MPSARNAVPCGDAGPHDRPRPQPGSILSHLDALAVEHAEPRRILRCELEQLLGDREVQRRRDLDLGRGPDRPVGAEAQASRCSPPPAAWRAGRAAGCRSARASPPRARGPASEHPARRSARASGPRRTEPPPTSWRNAIGLVRTPRSRPARLAISAITDQPARTSPGWRDRGAKPLQATVWVDDGALLLGAATPPGRSTLGVLTQAVGEDRGVGDHEARAAQRGVPQVAIGQLADRVGL